MKHLPRTQDTINVQSRDRVRVLERKSGGDPRPKTEEIATFCIVGDMAVSTSPKYRVRVGGQIVAVTEEATAAGTGTTEFDVLLSGSALGSGVSLASATTSQVDYLGDHRAKNGDTIQIDLTAAGMHEGLVIQVVMKG